MKSFILFMVVVVGLIFEVSAAEVIVNPGTKITAKELRDIYFGEMAAADGVTLQLLDNAAVQEMFVTAVLKMSIAKYQSIWIKKAFRDGLIAPVVKSGDAGVIEFVKQTRGAVGYVDGPAPAGVKSILKF